jgi:hypothetical protein
MEMRKTHGNRKMEVRKIAKRKSSLMLRMNEAPGGLNGCGGRATSEKKAKSKPQETQRAAYEGRGRRRNSGKALPIV